LKINTKAAVFIAAFMLLMGYAGVQTVSAADNDELDTAIRELSDYLNKRIPAGSKVVFLNIRCDYPDFSEYIISALMENGVNDEVFTVVDRQQLDIIRAEQNFQWSGEVSDKSAQEIGQLLGAQTIVSGVVTEVGNDYKIQVRALAVQTASVQGQFSQNVNSRGSFVKALTTDVVAMAAREKKNEEDAQKRLVATDKFLKNSGIVLAGWGGYIFNRDVGKWAGGGDLGVRLFKYFDVQTGFEIVQDMDNRFSEQIVTQTLLQIPVLARFNLSMAELHLSAYGGIGINLSPFSSNDAVIQSISPLSFIVGGELGFLSLFIGYQFNRDLSETVCSYGENNFSYFGQRSMMTFGLRLFIPFRKSETSYGNAE